MKEENKIIKKRCLISLFLIYILPIAFYLINKYIVDNDINLEILITINTYLLSISIIIGYLLAWKTKEEYNNSKFSKIIFNINTIIILGLLFFWIFLWFAFN